jgi:hypothetical protein
MCLQPIISDLVFQGSSSSSSSNNNDDENKSNSEIISYKMVDPGLNSRFGQEYFFLSLGPDRR